jgi:hypothetical protein
MDAKVNDKVNVASGLATGGTDPRSTNQTLDNFFETPDIRLEYAYVLYVPFNQTVFSAGKIQNPLWRPSGLLWDSDIFPNGISMDLAWDIRPEFSTFLNTGFFVLDESSGYNADPVMWAVQPGFRWGLTEKLDIKGAFNYYGFNGLKGKAGENRSNPATNTTDTGGRYVYKYDSIGASAELGFKKPFDYNGFFENLAYMGIFGDFIYNSDPSNDRHGWLIGAKIGHAGVKEPGQWQGVYNFRKLQKDAWLDIFPDSDFYGGATDVKGHEIKFHYGLMKNVNFTAGYFHSERLSGGKRKENLFQADLVFKF